MGAVRCFLDGVLIGFELELFGSKVIVGASAVAGPPTWSKKNLPEGGRYGLWRKDALPGRRFVDGMAWA